MSKHNDFLNSNHIELWDLLFNKNKKNITKFKKFVFKNNTKNPKIILTFTTCKRFDLFKQTINSILNTWLDIDKIDWIPDTTYFISLGYSNCRKKLIEKII